MSISTSKILGKLGRSAAADGLAEQSKTYDTDTPKLMPTPSSKKDKDMQNALVNALNFSSSKKHSPMD